MTIGTSIWSLPAVSRVGLAALRSAGGCRLVGGGVIVVGVVVMMVVVVGVVYARVRVRVEDRARIGRPDRRDGPRLVVVEGVGRAVLDVRDGRVLGVPGQPVVDELLDDPAPAQGRADVVPAAVALEVLRQ